MTASHPRPSGFVLNIGITGHRLDRLAQEAIPALRGRLDELLARIAAEWETPDGLPGARPRFCLVSALAEGADRLAAQAALARGWDLECPLPFARDTYALDFTASASQAEFQSLLACASTVWELGGAVAARRRRRVPTRRSAANS